MSRNEAPATKLQCHGSVIENCSFHMSEKIRSSGKKQLENEKLNRGEFTMSSDTGNDSRQSDMLGGERTSDAELAVTSHKPTPHAQESGGEQMRKPLTDSEMRSQDDQTDEPDSDKSKVKKSA